MIIKSFEDLEIYKLSEELTIDIYKLTSRFPKEEQFGLTSQIRRASASIGANIAEGFGRFHYKDRIIFLYHSRGSLFEVQHFLRLGYRLEFISLAEKELLTEKTIIIGVKINNFISSIQKKF